MRAELSSCSEVFMKAENFSIRPFTKSLLILELDHTQKAISHPKTACENPGLLLRNNHFKN